MATTISSLSFNHDAGWAKSAAQQGPVFITDLGKPTHVLLSIQHYHHLIAERQTLADLLAMPGSESIELPLPRQDESPRPASFN